MKISQVWTKEENSLIPLLERVLTFRSISIGDRHSQTSPLGHETSHLRLEDTSHGNSSDASSIEPPDVSSRSVSFSFS